MSEPCQHRAMPIRPHIVSELVGCAAGSLPKSVSAADLERLLAAAADPVGELELDACCLSGADDF